MCSECLIISILQQYLADSVLHFMFDTLPLQNARRRIKQEKYKTLDKMTDQGYSSKVPILSPSLHCPFSLIHTEIMVQKKNEPY